MNGLINYDSSLFFVRHHLHNLNLTRTTVVILACTKRSFICSIPPSLFPQGWLCGCSTTDCLGHIWHWSLSCSFSWWRRSRNWSIQLPLSSLPDELNCWVAIGECENVLKKANKQKGKQFSLKTKKDLGMACNSQLLKKQRNEGKIRTQPQFHPKVYIFSRDGTEDRCGISTCFFCFFFWGVENDRPFLVFF